MRHMFLTKNLMNLWIACDGPAEVWSWANLTWPTPINRCWLVQGFGTCWVYISISQAGPDSSLPMSHCLFGHRLSPAVFCKFAHALNFIAQFFGADPFFNYVDDFLTVQKAGSGKCAKDLGAMDQACELTSCCGKPEKREGPTTCLSTLSIEVNTIDWEMQIRAQHLAMVMEKLLTWRDHSKASKQEIASLHGHLSFITCVVKPGQIFLHRVVEEMECVSSPDDLIELSAEFHTELDWWRQFLPEWNGICVIPKFQWTSNADFDFLLMLQVPVLVASGRALGSMGSSLTGHARRAWLSRSCSQ